MARKSKSADTSQPTVEARHAAEAERQATARAERDRIAAETDAARKATAKRLAAKPADTRGLA